jgi:lipopolysaccharide biosynthesis glycosyltransferase
MQDKTVNLFLVTDKQNLGNLYVTLLMLLDKAKNDWRYHIFILFNEIAESDKTKIQGLTEKNELFKVSFHCINEYDFVTDLPSDSPHTSKVGRFKYLIGNFDLEKALYIDTDILLRADVSELFQLNLDGFIIGAVPDINNRVFNKLLKLPPQYNYFNSGVLLIDCVQWKRHNTTQRLFDVSVKREKDLAFVDQDTFNIVCSETGYKKLALSWNFPAASQYFSHNIFVFIKKYWRSYSILEIIKSFQNPYFVHFIGKPKPNDGNLKTAYSLEYLAYFKRL